jgi:DNA polymerase III sliding clamp (beta) subunit (PCNA family)
VEFRFAADGMAPAIMSDAGDTSALYVIMPIKV